MFIYLSKKIAIPNNTRLRCIGWNKDHGYIACGGDDGLLKVLKLESGKDGKIKGLAAPSNLSMNQTLEGHNGQVQVVEWNEKHQKLTSSDQFGLIIVWMLYKGSWYEEMINNRNKSVVKGMSWNSDGQKICIVYEDGAVIVGSVDGNRIWGKELKSAALSGVCWSPDSRLLLFSMASGEVHVYDAMGLFVAKISIQCLTNLAQSSCTVVTLSWYNGRNGYVSQDCPALVICYNNGRVQIMRHESDDSPVLIDTGMSAVGCQWSHDGSILAVAGTMVVAGASEKESNVVQFYSPHGEHLRTLKVPGRQITACAWEGGSLRIALSVDSFIYFANIRPNYKWAYFSNVVVYTYNRIQKKDTAVVFWNHKTGDRNYRYVQGLISISAAGEHCVLATNYREPLASGTSGTVSAGAAPSSCSPNNVQNKPSPGSSSLQYQLLLCNALGTPVDTKVVSIEPLFTAVTSGYVFAASKDAFIVWHFRTVRSSWTPHLRIPDSGQQNQQLPDPSTTRGSGRDRLFHVDENPTGVLGSSASEAAVIRPTADPICCIAASEKILLVARESGSILRYALPNVAQTNRYTVNTKPYRLALNCNSTCLSMIDVTGLLQFLDLDGTRGGGTAPGRDQQGAEGHQQGAKEGELVRFERKDVWDMKWASDNPDLFAMMEKTRMYIFRNLEPEEPILSAGYICSFADLEIRAVLLDEILRGEHPDTPTPDLVLDLEVKSLRDTRDLLEKVGIKDALSFIEENPHPRLWRLLAEAAVEDGGNRGSSGNRAETLATAEAAYVRCKDYPGIQLTKRLARIQNETVRKGEVAAWFQNYDEAERLFLEVDRRDLAVALRRKLGDWFKVVQLLRAGGGGNDQDMEEAWNHIGDYFAERHRWEEAAQYYEKGRNPEMLVQAYYHLEDYDSLESLMDTLQPDDRLLATIGNMFASVGLGQQAVDAFVKCNQISNAIETCVNLNQWHQAVELATRYNQPNQIASLLAKYAQHLLEEDKVLQAIELYRKANHFLEASRLLASLAREEAAKRSSPLRIKKLYVLGALLVEEHQARVRKKNPGAVAGGRSAAALLAAGPHDEVGVIGPGTTKAGNDALDSSWRGAEAYHFLMVCQRQLYEGFVDAAMKTALHLRDYEDILNQEDVYSLLALSSCANRQFGTCSRAFIKLEALEELDEQTREEYQHLAMDIFVKHSPKDSRGNRSECASCETLIPDWVSSCPSCQTKFPICIVTGRPIMDQTLAWTCNTCHHLAHEQDIALKHNCPMCHAPLND